MPDYSLDTGKKYIKDIFASDCFYNIPDYQRAYVWGKEQITDLLEDISSALEHDKKKEYFLGCMIWNTKTIKEGDFEYPSQDILDGQQRFISLYILQAVIRDLSTDKKLKDKAKERMRQEEDKFDGIPERNRVEFQIREDKDFIDKYLIPEESTDNTFEIERISNNNEESLSVRNMARAIITFVNWWLDKAVELGNDVDFQNYLSEFYTYLSSKVLALYLATSDNLDDAYNLFTVLNSRGLQLQASDILRAQNLRVIGDEKLRKKYATNWEEYENTIDSPYKTFDEFLWAMVYIKMKYRSDSNQSLSKAFNFMYEKNLLDKGSSTFDFIGRYVKHLEVVTSSIAQDDSGFSYANIYYILNTTFTNSYITPLMHYRECFGENGIVDFLIKLDNLFSAYWLTDNRNLQSRIFIILRKMDEIKKDQPNSKAAAEIFLNDPTLTYGYSDDKAATAIDINKLFKLFEDEKWGAFSGTRVNKARYVLLKLDLLMSNINTQISFNKISSSLEHVMPQKIENTEWNISIEDHKEWLHRLGNIVLIDRRKNASFSNYAFADKKFKFRGSIESRANTTYVFMKYDDWNINNIINNHSRINDILKEYYLGNSLKTLKEMKRKIY